MGRIGRRVKKPGPKKPNKFSQPLVDPEAPVQVGKAAKAAQAAAKDFR